jgi:Domain of unknown function (DUF4129)
MGEDQALERLQAILARPEYHVGRDLPWWQQLLAPLIAYAWNLLSQLIALVVNSASGHEGSLGLVVLVVSAAAVIAALVYLVRAVRLSVVRETELRGASLAERRERSDQLWQSAQQLAAAGDFAQALRLLYLSALYALDEHALLHVEFNLTNREHAQRLKQAYPALGDSFTELVDRYERVRYGRASVPAEHFADFTARAQRVRSAALGSAPA